MIPNQADTIAAISTAPGEGGIGIVRISGPDALAIADAIFRGKKQRRPSQCAPFTVHYGFIIRAGGRRRLEPARENVVDEVLLTVMRAPRSYTCEDTVEISCHGGILPLRKILDAVLSQGARLAAPGEFTQRAFMHGRIDLAQAEAVLQVINAKSEPALGAAMSQLQGALSEPIGALRRQLIEILVPLEAALDFPEEGLSPQSQQHIRRALRTVDKTVSAVLENAEQGILLNQGIRVALAGSPNVGKSSLMNAFMEYERVIVTSVSGTTRDIVEEVITIDGVPVRLADTAGIMDSDCAITQESVRRTLSFLEHADVVLLLVDATRPVNAGDRRVARALAGKRVIVVVNKIDAAPPDRTAVRALFPGAAVVGVSAATGQGLSCLKKHISRLFARRIVRTDAAPLVTSVRHKQALELCRRSVRQALAVLAAGRADECLVFEVREALRLLGEITGESAGEEVLDAIFSRFCIGK